MEKCFLFLPKGRGKIRVSSIIQIITISLFLSGGQTRGGDCAKPAEQWTMGRGSVARTGVSDAKLPDDLARLWQFRAEGGIVAEVAIAKQTVYAATIRGHLYALDLATGEEKWGMELDSGVEAAPAYREGRLYVVDDGGKLYCLDTETEETTKTLWTYDEARSECHSSPAIIGKRVLYGAYDQNLHCVDALTGKGLWTFETEGPLHGAPTLAHGQAFVSGCDSVLRAIDIESGKEAWSLEMDSYTAANPAVEGDFLYVGHFGGQVIAVNLKSPDKILWSYPETALNCELFSSCAVTKQFVIVGGRDKNVHCIKRETGKKAWIFPTKGDVDASPLVSGQRVFVGSRDGTFYGLDLATGRKVWHYVSGAPIVASAAIVTGKIIVGDERGTLLCFAEKKEKGE